MSLFDLSGKAVVVTGGAGHLGSAICKGLSDHGARVLSLSSRPPAEICDVADEEAFDAKVKAFAERAGPLWGIVNCAGRGTRGADLEMSAQAFRYGLETIVLQFTCSRIAARYMGCGGSIVMLGSLWGMRAPDPKIYLDLGNGPSIPTPCAFGGIAQLTKYLAVLLAPNIRVNAIVPGWFPKSRGAPRPDYIAGITARTPMRRIGQPADLIGAAVFLMSDASAFMSGQQLVIDGGYSIQ